MSSEVLQGSVLGSVPFSFFINDPELRRDRKVVTFTVDTKLFRTMKTQTDCGELQKVLSMLDEWAKKLQINSVQASVR